MEIPLVPSSISIHALDALTSDSQLPICRACGTQYPAPRVDCPICEDPRQFVPPAGQAWTTLADLSEDRVNKVFRDEEDGRVCLIYTEPGFGINQTPILLDTASGSYIWDTAAFLSPPLVAYLSTLPNPLKGIAVSHPHFFTTSLTWSRVLRVPLYLCTADRMWFQRLADIDVKDEIVWWSDQIEMGPNVKLIQCGGHFSGSCILHWDRLGEAPPPSDHLPTRPTPVSGLILTADTLMVQPTQKGFTFMWSFPNLVPLRPKDVVNIWKRVESLPFGQASSTWPDKWIREDAKGALRDSVHGHLMACGWRLDGDELIPL